MTGVQTCALPICFPVTIRSQRKVNEEQAKAIPAQILQGWEELTKKGKALIVQREQMEAYARKKYWDERLVTLKRIKKLSESRYRQRDTYYTRDDLLAADEIEQQAAELERAGEVEEEAKKKKAFDKVQWFLGQGENFPHFLTKAWRNEALQDFTKRRHVDELYDKYREVVKDYVANSQTQMAEELVGDFLFLLNQIVRARRPATSWRNY